MLDKLIAKWQTLNADPVKNRMIQVVAVLGGILLPCTVAAHYGVLLEAILGTIFGLMGLLFLAWSINGTCGWIAEYVLTGKLDWFNFDRTILEVWERHQNKQKVSSLSCARMKKNQEPQVASPTYVAPQAQEDQGPDWLNKS